jgi:hypothetical protein
MREDSNATQAGISAQQAARGAFGGSRGALMSAQENRGLGERVAQMTAAA